MGDKNYKKLYKSLLKKYKGNLRIQNYMQTLLDSLTELIIIVGLYHGDYVVKLVNQPVYDLLGYDEEDIIGMKLNELIKEGIDEIYIMNSDNAIISNIEKTYIKKDGSEIPVLFSVTKIKNENEAITEFVCVGNDLTVQKESEKRWKEFARKDKMTGTLNRGTGIKKLEKKIDEVKRDEKDLTIAFIDLNDLKKVNDNLGHKKGDELIKIFSRLMLESIGSGDFVFRIGGDEFVMVFFGKDLKISELKMQDLLKKIKEINKKEDLDYKISISYGLQEYPRDESMTVDHLINLADVQMYNMKKEIKENACRKRERS
ncbi:MAG: diguanylate cyclase [Fusobacteriota bacterium]